MQLEEITQLIAIRDYIVNATCNFNLNRDDTRELSKMLILVDKRIVEKLLAPEFKKLINFAGANKAMADAIDASSGTFKEANEIKKSEREKL